MIADLIRQYCKENNTTQQQLADKIGIPRKTLLHWIDKNHLPTHGKNYYCGKRLARLIGYEKSEPPKAVERRKVLTVNGYVPNCSNCVWHIDCGDDIVYCAKPGMLCVNARR